MTLIYKSTTVNCLHIHFICTIYLSVFFFMYIWSSITVHFTSSPYECSFGNFCHAFSVMCHPMEKKKKAQDSNLETHMWILFCYDLGNLSALVSRSVNGLPSFSLSSQVSVCPSQERLWGWGNNVTPCLSRAYKSSQSVWRRHWSAHADCHACHCMWLWEALWQLHVTSEWQK